MGEVGVAGLIGLVGLVGTGLMLKKSISSPPLADIVLLELLGLLALPDTEEALTNFLDFLLGTSSSSSSKASSSTSS